MTISKYFLVIAPLIAKLDDGHFPIYHPYNILSHERTMFPLKLFTKFSYMSAIVSSNFSESSNCIHENAFIGKINNYEIKSVTTEIGRDLNNKH